MHTSLNKKTEMEAVLDQNLFDTMLLAIQHQFGDGAKSCTRDTTACHETGHVITHHLLGKNPSSAKIWKRQGLWHGYNEHDPFGEVHSLKNPENGIAVIMSLCAGWVGEEVFAKVIDQGSSADERINAYEWAVLLSNGLGIDPLAIVTATEDRTRVLLQQYEFEAKKLVQELKKRNKLGRHQILRLLTDVPVLSVEKVGHEVLAVLF